MSGSSALSTTLRNAFKSSRGTAAGPGEDAPFEEPRIDATEILVQDPLDLRAMSTIRAARSLRASMGVRHVPIANVQDHAIALASGKAVPLGTGEFMRRCMDVCGFLPRACFGPYPTSLGRYFLQSPRVATVAQVLASPTPVFVRPYIAGVFEPFVFSPGARESSGSSQVEARKLADLPPQAPVWMSHYLDITCEWRCLISAGGVVDIMPKPVEGLASIGRTPIEEISAIVSAVPRNAVGMLHVALLHSGETTLLGAYGPWALDRLRLLDFDIGGEQRLQIVMASWGWLVAHGKGAAPAT